MTSRQRDYQLRNVAAGRCQRCGKRRERLAQVHCDFCRFRRRCIYLKHQLERRGI